MGGVLFLRLSLPWRGRVGCGLRVSRNSRCWSGVPPSTSSCFSARSLPFEALLSIGTHIACFSPSFVLGLFAILVVPKLGLLSSAEPGWEVVNIKEIKQRSPAGLGEQSAGCWSVRQLT